MIPSEPHLSEEIYESGSKYFGPIILSDARKLVFLSKASISFTKGNPDKFYIISGIVKENKAHECKLVFKKRLEDAPEGPLSSNCDCTDWKVTSHCKHVACLFLIYHLKRKQMGAGEMSMMEDNGLPPLPILGDFSVNVDQYGTIVGGPHKLQGAPTNPTYASLSYLLHTRKVINFPLPSEFTGRLLISFNSPFKVNDENFAPYNPIFFQYENAEGEVVKEISVFENLYLFNWKNGTVFHLPRILKELVQKIRFEENNLSVNDLIRLTAIPDFGKYCELIINEVALPNLPIISAHPRVEINPSKKRGQIDFSLFFMDDESKKVLPPQVLRAFTFSGGLLNSFKRKSDAYLFIESLNESLTHQTNAYKRFLVLSSQKKRFENLIQFTLANRNTLVFDQTRDLLISYDNHFVLEMIMALYTSFGDFFYRFSVYDEEYLELNFQVSNSVIYQGLSKFHRRLSPFGLSIYYNKKEISNWKSRIRFERKSHNTNWFDLELQISNEDLAIIRGADLDKGIAVSDQGLHLFSEEEKSLLRLMKKYTQYEGEEKSDPEKGDGFSKYLLPFNRSRIFELFELKKLGIDGALTEEEKDLCERLSSLQEMPQYEVPENLKKVARPYQIVGYNWLRFLYENRLGACLADDMGLGKTLQAIALLESVYDKITRVLIVCPVSILINWEKEIQKFSDMDCYIFHGGERTFPEDQKIVLTSYGVMKREIDKSLKDKHFDILILDEVQHLKNIRSMGAFAARKINAGFRMCLTGTPVENDLVEFYNILDLAIPGIWGDLGFVKTSSQKKSRLLARKSASPFILRRTKSQVLTDLPDKIENTVYLSFTDDEKEHYDNTLKNIKNRIQNSPPRKKYGEILMGLLKLRQSCLWQKPTVIGEEDIPPLRSTKVDFLMETLEQILEEGHQAIVFSQFTTYLNIIEEKVRDKHWKMSRIDGTQNVKRRQKEVDTFQDNKSQVFLISLKAGGVGLNLTAASYVFIMDPWWNPAVEAQAVDRAHRIGQKNTLTVYRPIIKDSVEEKVLSLQEYKKELFYDLLPDNDDNFFTGKLTMKDFEQLFN